MRYIVYIVILLIGFIFYLLTGDGSESLELMAVITAIDLYRSYPKKG